MTERLLLRRAIAGASVLLLAGCATVDIDREIAEADRSLAPFTQGRLALARDEAGRTERAEFSERLLGQALGLPEAVQLALANSPSMQALLADGWSRMAQAEQDGRIPNPVFAFERIRLPHELELGRVLSFGLLDLITLPQRQALARNRIAQARVELAAGVVQEVSRVRQAWVRAVAAQEMLGYAGQVRDAAEASAELARRMRQAGNFNTLQQARQHAFYADATASLAAAQHAATAAREELVRALGLDEVQAQRLQLPPRLPELPTQPHAPDSVAQAAREQRLDFQLARLQLEAAGRAQGLDLAHSLVDTEVGLRRDTVFESGGERATGRGFELALRLPVFDWGAARRAGMKAQALAAAQHYEAVTRSASSELREAYSAYRTAWELARHHREELVPLRRTIAEENLLRYNGMLIGVFDLLADTREQIASVMAAIQAHQQFWLADASLAAALVGQRLASAPAAATAARPAEAAPH